MTPAGRLAARPPSGEGWLDVARRARDRLLASPRFQRWAASFPLTRPIAQRRARALFDLCAGFVYSQVLLACVQLRLFDQLADGPVAPEVLAQRAGMSPARMQRLLEAAASLRLVERRGRRYGLGPLGAAMLGNPAVAAMVGHHPLLYADLADPVALLRGDRPQTALGRYWAYAQAEDGRDLGVDEVGAYTRLMAASQPLVAGDILDAFPLRGHRCLLDVGGGDGAFLVAAAARAPGLRLMLLDLPPVVQAAEKRMAAEGLSARFRGFGGDFHRDPLPGGADLVSLVRVVHDHDDEAALRLLQSVFRVLPPGGTLLLAEPMAGTAGAEPVGAAYFGFYLLAMGSGRARTAVELAALLTTAGFGLIEPVRTRRPMLTGLISAIKRS